MHPLFQEVITKCVVSESIRDQVIAVLNAYGKKVTLGHSLEVSDEAKRLAMLYSEDIDKAETAALLHDISAVIPNDQKIQLAEFLSIDILDEERLFPLVIHQKLSQEMARSIFNICDDSILNAIGCHTTLKANPSKLDMILFIADKLKWDQGGISPYFDVVMNGLEVSLEQGVFAFLTYQYQNRSQLKVIHPWLIDAYSYFESRQKLNNQNLIR